MSIGLTLIQKGFDKVIEKGEAKFCRKKFPGRRLNRYERKRKEKKGTEEAKERWNGERGNRP
ncbi:hypothetical protein C4D60_Mb06t00850 [Musa balbisiana]|uniref:Uncharacterized protein n=1 Tax=Musa balbisiana TaxID=52838 RepID=A0A4S8IL09_MUSBA|nr:hypothetical protein C4D60_Mb06t00850 [Musa balbisiana]